MATVSISLSRYNSLYYLSHEKYIMTPNKARAYFMLAGYLFDPDNLTAALGLQPTSVNSNGSGSALDKPILSSWEISTDTVENVTDVYALVDILLKQIEPKKDIILKVIEGYNLSPRISIVLTLSTDKSETCPDVGLGARTIRFLAEIGAFINIEYELSERI